MLVAFVGNANAYFLFSLWIVNSTGGYIMPFEISGLIYFFLVIKFGSVCQFAFKWLFQHRCGIGQESMLYAFSTYSTSTFLKTRIILKMIRCTGLIISIAFFSSGFGTI